MPHVPMQTPGESSLRGRPTWAEINLGALAGNYRRLAALVRPADSLPYRPRLIPVIKANAYGHGAVEVARALTAAGATAFAVAIVEEGIQLRDAGISAEILVLEGVWPGQEPQAVAHNLTPTLFSPRAVRAMELAAAERAAEVAVHLKIDTGMNRLGAAWNDLGPLMGALTSARHLRVTGTFTHFACAEEEDQAFTKEQTARFLNALSAIREGGINPGEIHAANSAGLLYGQGLRSWSARPGIALYGYPPAHRRRPEGFEPVLSLKTRIGHLHRIEAGESVGYNRGFTSSRKMRVATLPAGYADGFRRSLSGKSNVIVRDSLTDVLGTISMDLVVVDVTGIPEAREGDEVILLGRSPSCRLDAEVWADLLGTIPYEVLCGISPRVPRLYKESRSNACNSSS
jgi:alanine racemase